MVINKDFAQEVFKKYRTKCETAYCVYQTLQRLEKEKDNLRQECISYSGLAKGDLIEYEGRQEVVVGIQPLFTEDGKPIYQITFESGGLCVRKV
jgi:hypothetical protein